MSATSVLLLSSTQGCGQEGPSWDEVLVGPPQAGTEQLLRTREEQGESPRPPGCHKFRKVLPHGAAAPGLASPLL